MTQKITTRKRTRQMSAEAEDAKDYKDSKNDTKLKGEKFISKKIKADIDAKKEKDSNMVETDDEADLEYENLQVSEYERKRQENLLDNAQFMATIGIHQTKRELELSTDHGMEKYRSSIRQKSKPNPKFKRVFQPTRRSARIQHMDPSGASLPPVVVEETERNPRKPPENLTMGDVLEDTADGSKERHSLFANNLKSLSAQSTPLELKEPTSTSLKNFLKDFSKIKITEDRVRKVVESRIFSLTVHPTEDKILVGAGGKWGSVGLWDVNQGISKDGAVLYYPHSKPVNCLEFSPHNPEQLFSCGYDGTLRCGHFEKNIFENIYYTPEDDDLLLRNFVFLSPHVLLVAQSDGNVAFIDKRTDGYTPEKLFRASPKDLRTVDLHPTKQDYIITASLDCSLSLWDMRNMKVNPKKIFSVSAGRMLNSGYFSPLTGNYILTTSQDNLLRIYDSSKLISPLPCLHAIKHDMQTGRWLTKFRAVWHPSREDLFVSGSMARPRQIELFSTDGYRVKTFEHSELINSVQSLNKFHPTLNVLVGANASGKLHVFM